MEYQKGIKIEGTMRQEIIDSLGNLNIKKLLRKLDSDDFTQTERMGFHFLAFYLGTAKVRMAVQELEFGPEE